jgi:L-serine dehydratase
MVKPVERISIFDIFKIGVGPSSSHTLGPWKAALDFRAMIRDLDFDKIEIHLFGSLSKTGIGHATDIAVQMGLLGHDPRLVDISLIAGFIDEIKERKQILIHGKEIFFDAKLDIIFENTIKQEHPNTLTFKAFKGGIDVKSQTYYSLGGGFIKRKGQELEDGRQIELPWPIDCGEDLEGYLEFTSYKISDIVRENELQFRTIEEIDAGINSIYKTMLECVYKGCSKDGILPGGLNVKRRAKALNDQLMGGKKFENAEDWINHIKGSTQNFNEINKWISCFALAVNEENAALGRVVTSPTNGAAGVIPAVLFYYYCFCDFKGFDDIQRFFFTSGEIGCIFKKGATISAAVGGCQAEIGVSSAMAAAGLTELLGGSPQQVLMAAEIAMEHHLGMTCDPIGGLVQIPCIERNAMGAMKAITASNLALCGNPKDAIVKFDLVVKAMWDTAQDMNGKYKETSEGGLAFNLPVAFPSC